MKGKLMAGALAGATIATGSVIPVLNNINSTNNISTKSANEVLLSQPVSNTSGQEAVVINGDNNLALFNSADSQSVNSYLSTGEMLTIMGHEGNFYKVTVHETGAVGYISASNAQIIESGISSPFNKNIADGSIINVSTSVHLRSQPDLGSGILKNLKNNTSVEVLGTQGQWVKVNVHGTIGYIYESYVSIGNTASATTDSSSTSASSITASSNVTNSTNNNVNNNTNKIVANNTSKTVSNNTNKVVADPSSSSSANSSNSVSDKNTSNSTNTNQTHDKNTTKPEVSNSQSNINITLNDSAYIKAAPNVDFHNGTTLDNSSKSTVFNNKQIDNVTVLNKQNNYYEVKLADGSVGLVNQNYIVFSGNANKSAYLNKLNDLSIKTYNIFATPTAQESQTNMNIYSGQCAEMWEHQLKDMYSSLMNTLPQNKAKVLEQSENQFNAHVNSVMKQVAKDYEGGSITPLMENMNYQDLTMERCFALANEYPELYNSTTVQNNQGNTVNKNNSSNSSTTSNTPNKTVTGSNSNTPSKTVTNSNNNETSNSSNSNSSEQKSNIATNNNQNGTNTNNNGNISSRTKSSPATNNQNSSKEKYINSNNGANGTNNNNENNSNNNVVNVKTGAGYSQLNQEAGNHAMSSSTLDQLVYTHINDSFAPCRNYVSYNEISNVINNGTQAQKEALIQKYGSTCLVVNLGTSSQSVTPELYYNGQFYFKFTCTNLYSLINNPNNKYTGVIDSNGQAPTTNTYNTAVNNHEVFALGSSQPTWASSQVNC